MQGINKGKALGRMEDGPGRKGRKLSTQRRGCLTTFCWVPESFCSTNQTTQPVPAGHGSGGNARGRAEHELDKVTIGSSQLCFSAVAQSISEVLGTKNV